MSISRGLFAVLLLSAGLLVGCNKTLDSSSGWRIREVSSPLLEGGPLRALEVRPPGTSRWQRVEEIVSLWKPVRGGQCIVVAVPAPPRGGMSQGDEILISCDGGRPLLVFQEPELSSLWAPDGIYEELRAVEGLPDGTRVELWVTFEELLERYDHAVAQEQ